MTRFIQALVIGFCAALGATPADACLAWNFERWVFIGTPPADVPDGLIRIRVDVPDKIEAWGMIEVNVVEGEHAVREGDRIRISPGLWTSCSRWGVTGSPAYVIGVLSIDSAGRRFLAAVQQRRPDHEQDMPSDRP